MILADTSVWIDKFRNLQTAGVRRLSDPNNLQFLIVGDLIMTGPTLTNVNDMRAILIA